MQRIALARVTLPTISKMTTASPPTDCPVLVQPAQPDSLDALDSSSVPVPTLDSLITATTPSEPTTAASPTLSTTQFDVSEPRIPFNLPRLVNPAANPTAGPFMNTFSSSVGTQQSSIILSLDDFELAGLMESEDYDNDGDYYDSDDNGYDSDARRRRRRRQRQQRRPERPTRSSSEQRTRQLETRVPAMPDMRFEQQLLKNIAAQVAQNRSSQYIFWTTIVRDQVAMPFLNGFAWKFVGLWWAWTRLRRQGSPEGRSFWRDVWGKMNAYMSNIYDSAIQVPALLTYRKEANA